MRSALLLSLLLLSGCFSNPLGSSVQTSTYHPGYGQPPRILSVNPTSGALQGGTDLTIVGSGFQQGSTVTIGGASCTSVVFVSDSKLTCVTPGHTGGAASVTVTNPDSQTTSLADAFQYLGSSVLTAGFGHASGGGVASGPGVRLRFTAGAFGNPTQQSGTDVKANIGLQGALTHP